MTSDEKWAGMNRVADFNDALHAHHVRGRAHVHVPPMDGSIPVLDVSPVR